jgi:hypothetical protein
MYFPQNGDFIDIHVHGGTPSSGIFILESLMAHESKIPATFWNSLCFSCDTRSGWHLQNN